MDTSPTFASLPLRTPESIAADPQSILAILPAWCHAAHLVCPEGYETDPTHFSPAVALVFGKKKIVTKNYSALQVAFMFEVTRFPGISFGTNPDGKGRWYDRFTITGYSGDQTTASRIFSGAAEYDQAKVVGIRSDMRAENLRNDTANRIGKDARHVIIGHAGRVAQQAEAEGRMPLHLTTESYLANLVHLLHLIDQEARGRELHDLVAGILKPSREV